MTISWTKYIPRHLKEAYEDVGWRVDEKLKETPHGEYSYIGVWQGDGDPVMPDLESHGC